MNEADVLQLKNIRVDLKNEEGSLTILHDISVSFRQGSRTAIIGPSGSGKTTMLMVCAGLQAPSAGHIIFDGRVLPHHDEEALSTWRRESVGIVFQHFHLLPTSTALENVMLPLELAGELAGHDNPRKEATELLASVGLSHRLHHHPGQLSGGEQQRVALVRALARRPAILLADEPTGNLDQHTGKQVMDVLFSKAREHNTTLVLITHDPALAEQCDHAIHLSDGRVVHA